MDAISFCGLASRGGDIVENYEVSVLFLGDIIDLFVWFLRVVAFRFKVSLMGSGQSLGSSFVDMTVLFLLFWMASWRGL